MSLPQHIKTPSRTPVYALVGNPNCGKSTVFNALTGLKQKIGNYPGVTVERKVGTAYSQHGQPMTIIDLPGAYSLAARSPDEAVTRDVLLGRRADTTMPDRVVCVVDGSNLERNLYLVHQILDLGRPVILVVNMMDLATAAGLQIRIGRLEKELGIPVIATSASRGVGLIELKLALSRTDLPLPKHRWEVPAPIAPAVAELQASLQDNDGKPPLIARAEALLLLTDQDPVRVAGSNPLSPTTAASLQNWKNRFERTGTDWSAILVGARYDAIAALAATCVESTDTPHLRQSTSDKIDAVVTHGVWGWAVLGGIMTALFLSIFTFAEYPMNLIDAGVSALADAVKANLAPGDLRDLITDGAIAGVGGVVIFLPQILILFFFIGLLESTGYMARAAFIMDRLMAYVGLSGRSFIPLLSSFACAIPGIMATRAIADPKDRLTTILIAPLMTCSARLPVYAVIIAAVIPAEKVGPGIGLQGLVLFVLYLAGIVSAMVAALVLRRSVTKGKASGFIMEMPRYQMPPIRDLLIGLWQRAWVFLRRAGTIIFMATVILWVLLSFPKAGEGESQLDASIAGQVASAMHPAFEPVGFNREMTLALVPAMAAREVAVASLATTYAVDAEDEAETEQALRDQIAARWSLPSALAFLAWFVFAPQCLSTIAVARRETNGWKWPVVMLVYLFAAAYIFAGITYWGAIALGL